MKNAYLTTAYAYFTTILHNLITTYNFTIIKKIATEYNPIAIILDL